MKVIRTRYRLKITATTGVLATILRFAPNVGVFIAYDLSQTVLNNVGIANAVLSPFGLSVDIVISV